MAILKAIVRKERKDGFYPVYIRITHNRSVAYIITDKITNRQYLSKNSEITDPIVLEYCSRIISEYYNELNKQDISNWTAKDIQEYLINGTGDICFSDYARKHIDKLINNGQQRNSKNYKLALEHMERFFGTNRIMFSMLTSTQVNKWIETLKTTHRAKEMYPVCMRQIFKAATVEYNDYDTGKIRIKTNPWIKVNIPKADKAEKIAITPEACREFFSFPLPDSKMKFPVSEFGRDIAMMVLCLAGINTIDLYEMKKKDYHGGIIHYCRAKTKKFRADGAYLEVRVPPIIQPLFEKYRNTKDTDFLFNFHDRLNSSDSFNANVNKGIKQICMAMNIPKEQWYSVYTFRHTWGTVAQNDCRAQLDEVAFAMNHASAHKVTRGYIKTDYSPIWELNDKVIEFIFFSGKKSSSIKEREDEHFRLSFRYMINAAAYHNGQNVAEFTDTGYNNVDEVIAKLVSMLPNDIPERSIVMFKIVNLDKNQTAVYQRQKGKGF